MSEKPEELDAQKRAAQILAAKERADLERRYWEVRDTLGAPPATASFLSSANQSLAAVVYGGGFVVQFVLGLIETVSLNTPYTFQLGHVIAMPIIIIATAIHAALWPAYAVCWFLP